MNPLENQSFASPPSGGMGAMGILQGAPQAPQGNTNPLAALLGPMQGAAPSQMPAPSAAQTTAAVRRLSAVQEAMRVILNNPDLGRINVRPAIMDQASKLMAAKVLSLPETMQAIGKVTEDPLAQKSMVAGIFNQAKQAEANVLAHHAGAVATGRVPRSGGEKYRSADHAQHMADLLAHYPRG